MAGTENYGIKNSKGDLFFEAVQRLLVHLVDLN
jgi:hypothetical protein